MVPGGIASASRCAAVLAPLLLGAAFASVLPAALNAQARELTVTEAVRLGLEQNQGVVGTAAEAAAARAVARQVRARRYPGISTEATYTRLGGNIPDVEFTLPGLDTILPLQTVQLNRYHVELRVEQPLLAQLRLRREERAALHEAAAAMLVTEQERADVAYEVRAAYWNLYRAITIATTMDAAAARVDAHVAEVRSRVAEGAALPRDLLQAQTRRSEVQLERVEADNAVRLGRLELNRLLGQPLDTPLVPAAVDTTATDSAVAPAERLAAATVEPLTAADAAERPDIGALAEQVSGSRELLRAAEAERLPDLDFVGRATYARPNPWFFTEQDRFRSTWELGVSTRWDIWRGGLQSARVAEARSRLRAAEARLMDARERAMVDVSRHRFELLRAADAVGVARQNVREAEETLRVVRQQFGEGAALSSDVLDAEDALQRALARLAGARADEAIAGAAVLHALGRVW